MRYPRAEREIAAFGGAPCFRGNDVLDVGTGDGRIALEVARHARRVLGIDPDVGVIREAQTRAGRLRMRNATFRVGDAARLELGRDRFDVAIFSWSLC